MLAATNLAPVERQTVERRVTAIAVEMWRQTGRLPAGTEVGRRFAEEGGNAGTAETQYSKWIKRRLQRQIDQTGMPEDGAAEPRQGVAPEGGQEMRGVEGWLVVAPDGSLVLPPTIREAMRLDKSGKVRAEVVEGELRLSSIPVARDRLRALIRAHDAGTGSVVDELIRERRAEAARE